ncbi:MAG: DMT family transporter [Rhodovibrionaceae bacterium]|nr:DMT family transporter [Rhodovibrionaceae bacterium]
MSNAEPTSLHQRFYAMPQVLLTLTTLFWAGNAIAGRLAIGEVSPFTVVFLRWIIVTLMLWPIYGREIIAEWPVLRPRLKSIFFMAALGFTGFNALFYIAAHTTTAVNIGIIQGSMPVFVLLGAFAAYRTRVTGPQILGVALTIVGVTVVATKGAPHRLLQVTPNPGDLIMLVACMLYAFYAVALQKRPAISGQAFFTMLAPVAAITALPLAAWEATTADFAFPTAEGWMITLYIALFPSCLAQLFFLRGVDLIGPGRAGVYINLVPIFAAILGVGLLGEEFGLYHGAALALVIAGIMLAQRAPKTGW